MKQKLYFLVILFLFNNNIFGQSAPDSIKVTNGPHRIFLSWPSSKSVNVTYSVVRSRPGYSDVTFSKITRVNFEDTTLLDDVVYTYKVCSVDSLGNKSSYTKSKYGQAREIIFVSTLGKDSIGYGYEGKPTKTIQYAIGIARAKDTILIEDGTYKECLYFYKSATAVSGTGKELVLGSRFLLDGAKSHIDKTVIDSEFKGTAISVDNDPNSKGQFEIVGLVIKRMFRTVGATSSYYLEGGGIHCYGANKLIIRYVKFFDCRSDYVIWAFRTGLVIENCYFKGARNIYSVTDDSNFHLFNTQFDSSRNVSVSGRGRFIMQNVMMWNGSQLSEISVKNAFIDHCTLISTTATLGYTTNNSIKLSNSCSLTVSNSIIRLSNLSSQFDVGSGCSIKINNSNIYGGYSGTGNFDHDPKFKYNSLALSDSSSSIGRASSTNSISTDYYGLKRPRPSNSTPDVGAIENENAIPCPFLTASDLGDKKITVTWSQSSFTGLSNYKLYRSTKPISDTATVGIVTDTLSAKTLSYKDSGLTNLTRYYYRIKSVNSSGVESGFSNEISVRANTPPFAVDSVLLYNGPRSNYITWAASKSSPVKYCVYRGLTKSSLKVIRDTTSKLNFLDTGLTAWKTYYYAIRAIDSVGVPSAYSSIKSGVPNRVYYVSPTGLDIKTKRGGEFQPFATPNFALSVCSQNDTIILLSGRHRNRINLTSKSVTIGSKFILTKDVAYISNTKLGGNFTSDALIYETNSNSTINRNLIGFTIDSSYAPAIWNVSKVILDNLIISKISHYNWIGLRNSKMVNCQIKNNSAVNGVDVIDLWDSCSLVNCIFQNNYVGQRLFKIMPSAGFETRIENSLFFDNDFNDFLDIEGSGVFYFNGNYLLNNSVGSGYLIGIRTSSLYDTSYICNNYIDSSERLIYSRNGAKGIFKVNNNIIKLNRVINSRTISQSIVDCEGNVNSGLWISLGRNAIVSVGSTGGFFLKNHLQLLKNADTAGSGGNFFFKGEGLNFLTRNKFYLSNASSLIGSGIPNTKIKRDLNGSIRPNPSNSRLDIGPYENPAGFPSPALQTTEGGNEKITVTWSQSSFTGLNKYKLYRSTKPISDTATVGIITDTLSAKTLSYKDSGLTNLTRYYYRIKSVNSSGVESGFSNELSARPNTPPSAVDSVLLYNGPRSNYITWAASKSSPVKYCVYRGLTKSSLKVIRDTTSKLNFLDTGLTAWKTYYYAIRAIDSVGVPSAYSSIKSGVPNRVYYVSPTGLDIKTKRGGEFQPFATPNFALSVCSQNDTIILLSGRHRNRINLTSKSVTIGSKFILTKDVAYISNTKLGGNFTSDALIYETNSNSTINRNLIGFTIDSSYAPAIWNVSKVILDNLIISKISHYNWIGLRNSKMVNCQIKNNSAVNGVDVIDLWDSCSLVNCIFQNNYVGQRLFKIMPSAGFETRIENSLFFDNDFNDFLDIEGSGVFYFNGNYLLNNSVGSGYLIGIRTSSLYDTSYICNNYIDSSERLIYSRNGAKGIFKVNNNIIKLNRVINSRTISQSIVDCEGNVNSGLWISLGRNAIVSVGSTGGFFLKNHLQLLKNADTAGSGGNFFFKGEGLNFLTRNKFYLSNASSLIGSGIPNTKIKRDLNGSIRPNPSNSRLDIGPYENPAGFPSPALQTTEGGNEKITVTWSQSSFTGLNKYKLYRSTKPISDTATVGIITDTLSAKTLSYKDSGLTNLTRYYYRIKSVNSSGVESGFSNEMSARPNTPPSEVDSVLVQNGPRLNYISWAASKSSSVKYRVYRGTTKNNLQVIRDTILKSNYLDAGLTAWKTYYYAIRAIDSVGVPSAYSSIKLGVPNNIWWLDTAGNDFNSGNIISPKKDITTLLKSVKSRDTIILNDGLYYQNVSIPNGKRIVIGSRFLFDNKTSHIAKTVIDGSNTSTNVPLVNCGDSFFHITAITIQKSKYQAFVSDGNYQRSRISRVHFYSNGNTGLWGTIGIRGNHIFDSCVIEESRGRYSVTFNGSHSANYGYPTMMRSTFKNNGVTNSIQDNGAIFIEAGRGVVKNCLFYNNRSNCIVVGGNTSFDTVVIVNNTIVDNNSIALYFQNWGGGQGVYIVNNIIEKNRWNLWFNNSGYAEETFVNNVITPFYRSVNQMPNSSNHKIKLTNNDTNHVQVFQYPIADNAGLLLANNSDLIGRGADDFRWLIREDYSGKARPNPTGSKADLGAFENKSGFPSPTLSSMEGGNEKITLTWSQFTFTGLNKYKLYRSAKPISDTATVGLVTDTLSAKTLSYKDSGLTNLTR